MGSTDQRPTSTCVVASPPRRVMMQVNRSETWLRKVWLIPVLYHWREDYWSWGFAAANLHTYVLNVYNMYLIIYIHDMFWIFMGSVLLVEFLFFSNIYIYIYFFLPNPICPSSVHFCWGPHVESGYAGFVVAWCALVKHLSTQSPGSVRGDLEGPWVWDTPNWRPSLVA